MKTITVQELLLACRLNVTDLASDEEETGNLIYIYLVRDDDLVLYIGGDEEDWADHFQRHFGLGRWTWSTLPDELGNLILNNAPASAHWKVDLLTLADCQAVTSALPAEVRRSWRQVMAALIAQHRPCFNTPNPTPLPDRYVRLNIEEVERQRATTRVVAKLLGLDDDTGDGNGNVVSTG